MRQQRSGRERLALTPAVAWIIGISAACFLTLAFLSDASKAQVLSLFTLSGSQLAAGKVWTIVTTVALFPQLLAFFFDILMLWMFVPNFERFWGTRRFLIFFVVTLLAGNIVGGLVGMAVSPAEPLFGISPFIFACIAAFGVTFGQQPVQLFGVVPIKGRNLAIGMLVVVTVVVLLDRRWVFGASSYAAMVTAWLMTSGVWQPRLWILKSRRDKLKRKYQVLDGGKARDVDKRWMN